MSQVKTIVITGASDGIGAEAARLLKAQGHNVVIVGRNRQKTEAVAAELGAPCYIADYARLSDVTALAAALKSDFPHIDVLANNAGAMLNERSVTEDGVEKTFQVNVLAPFLLTRLLLDELCACNATVIQTSSIAANYFGRSLSPDDFQNEDYTAVKAYGRAKLCNVLFTRELDRRYAGNGISAVAFHPGIPRTNFACEAAGFFRIAYHSPLKYIFTTSKAKSARRLVHFATGTPGVDFERGETYAYKEKYKIKYKDDGTVAAKLWQACEALVSQFLA